MLLLLALLQPPPPPPAVPFDTPAAPDLEAIRKKAERLPDPPKLDPKNVHVPVRPEVKDRLLVEVAGVDGGKRRPVRVLVAAEVCMDRGPLEVFLTRKNTKEHEAILRTDLDARLIHEALVAAGGKPGSPVRFVNAQGEADYRPASGSPVAVGVHYTKAGKPHTHPAQEWIRDVTTKKPMAHRWVFAGSRLLKNDDRPADPPYYTANSGELVSISNFLDSMLDLPVAVSKDNAALVFEAWTDRLPPLLSGVWVTLEPGK